ncbi:MAG: STAS domain-containing protein [Bacteroidota bacterium]
MVFGYKMTSDLGFPVFNMMGELIDRKQANDLIAEVDRLVESGKNRFVLDMGKLKYINSSGLSVLIVLLTKARKNEGDVVICNVTPKVKELLVITKLNSVFAVTKDVESAIKKLK